jgi:hypothetical protein
VAVPLLQLANVDFPIVYSCGASCRPYPELPTYWLEVLGPETALVVLGIGLAAVQAIRSGGEPIMQLVLTWSLFCIVVGSLGYIIPWFSLADSDRTLLMLPVPMLSAVSTTWLSEKLGFLAKHQNLISVLVLVIPAITAPAIFAYLVPQRFRYYAPYVP